VTARVDESGDKQLVAYVVPEPESDANNYRSNGNMGAELRINQLRQHLMGKLPEYMVPNAFVQLEEIPLNPNGKIDRKSLPEPDKNIPVQEYVGPRNVTEEAICELWQQVLRRERVGIHDNFFTLGGHSLLAAQLASRIRASLSVNIPLRRMFEAPTVAQLADVIQQMVQTAGANGVSPGGRPAIKRAARKAALVEVD
jgi:acyl carrier protein